MIYWLHLIGVPLARALPLWVSYRIVAVIAWYAFLMWTEKREATIRNMALVLGEAANPRDSRRLARRAFANYAKYIVDMLRLSGLEPKELERRVTVNGWEHFLNAMSKGSGLIFVGAHLGNSDLAAAVLAGRGFPIHVIAEPLHPPRWDALVQAIRVAAGLKVIPLGSSALRFLRVLRQNEILAFLIDRPMDDQGVQVRFFGRSTWVPGGAAALALRSNAHVLGAFIVRSGDSYIAHISPVIPGPSTGDHGADLQALTQAIFDWLERVIRQYPDQWFMFRPMWPTPPSR